MTTALTVARDLYEEIMSRPHSRGLCGEVESVVEDYLDRGGKVKEHIHSYAGGVCYNPSFQSWEFPADASRLVLINVHTKSMHVTKLLVWEWDEEYLERDWNVRALTQDMEEIREILLDNSVDLPTKEKHLRLLGENIGLAIA